MLRTLSSAILISWIHLAMTSSLQDGDDFLDHLDDLDFADGTVLGLQRGYTIHKKKTVESEDLSADKREQATAKNEDGPFDVAFLAFTQIQCDICTDLM
eukprot:Skav227782  [mRNA]  locus=scaffold1237:150176:151158:+ [translate_table: standard]